MSNSQTNGSIIDGEAALERARLVRLCSRLTGDPEAAEDLAQETLLEGWRLASRLRDETGRFAWLAAIARNLCRRWARHAYQDRAWLRPLGDDVAVEAVGLESWFAAEDAELEHELERHEVALLLDRALSLLPPETGRVLIERYIYELPHAEIAARLGVSADAVSMRLTRGKLHLRRLLTNDLCVEASALGLCDTDDAGWEETRIWCLNCGQRRLLGCFDRPSGRLAFRCPGCTPEPTDIQSEFRLANPTFARLVAGLSRYKPALTRAFAWVDDYYRPGLVTGVVACTACGRPTSLRRIPTTPGMSNDPFPRLVARCAVCGEATSTSVTGLMLAYPAVRRFWREHGRMRTVPAREIDAFGGPALVVHVEAVASAVGLEIVCDRDTYAVTAVRPVDAVRAVSTGQT